MFSIITSLRCLRRAQANVHVLTVATAAVLSLAAAPASAQNVTVKVGTPGVASDAPLFIAVDKGYFAKQNINVEFVSFASAAYMVAPLAAGQLDVGAGGLSAGLYNAIARGFALRAVADKVKVIQGNKYFDLLVRKDLVTSGKYKTPADLKGLRIAEAGTATSTTYALDVIAKLGGHKYADSVHTSLAFPEHIAALKNKSMDASITVEPFLSRAIDAGIATQVQHVHEMVPNLQVAVVLYGGQFAKDKDVAQRFMNAYVEGARFYLGAIKDHRLDGPNAAEVASILTKHTRIKDPAVYRGISPAELDPNGQMNIAGMRSMLEFFKASDLIKGQASVEDLVDTSFVDQAVKTLGPYKPN